MSFAITFNLLIFKVKESFSNSFIYNTRHDSRVVNSWNSLNSIHSPSTILASIIRRVIQESYNVEYQQFMKESAKISIIMYN